MLLQEPCLVELPYTSKANRPMRINNAIVTDATSSTSRPIWVVSREEYINLPNKLSDGPTNQIYYDPQVGTGILNVWPETDSVNQYLTLWVQRTLEDFDAASDDADYPQEWYTSLSLGLASLSCFKYGVPRDRRRDINAMAREARKEAEDFDREDGFQIQPEHRY